MPVHVGAAFLHTQAILCDIFCWSFTPSITCHLPMLFTACADFSFSSLATAVSHTMNIDVFIHLYTHISIQYVHQCLCLVTQIQYIQSWNCTKEARRPGPSWRARERQPIGGLPSGGFAPSGSPWSGVRGFAPAP